MTQIEKATYSPEDNKLRLYPLERLNEENYQKVKSLGFKWAPVQKLFVAPQWTPKREDLCIELAGVIVADDTTLAERAEAKAERLDNLAAKRSQQASAYELAAQRISARMNEGQPILSGHHSERKARRDQKSLEKSIEKAEQCARAVQYWNYRAEGVERHANMKSDFRVVAGRIKTLLAELRTFQRDINHANICFNLWSKIQKENDELAEKLTARYVGAHIESGPASAPDLYSKLENKEVTWKQAIELCLDYFDSIIHSERKARWITHTLNRLAYERAQIGGVSRFNGKLTATILQAFAREQGAHKPKAEETETGWRIVSTVALPLHMAEGSELELGAEEWRDLMESIGYEVPAAKPKAPPTLNFRADSIKGKHWSTIRDFKQIELTKEQYAKINSDCRGCQLALCGTFKFKICPDPNHKGPGYSAPWVAVFLTDSKAHDMPESDAITALESV